jgi:hypothetical protein
VFVRNRVNERERSLREMVKSTRHRGARFMGAILGALAAIVLACSGKTSAVDTSPPNGCEEAGTCTSTGDGGSEAPRDAHLAPEGAVVVDDATTPDATDADTSDQCKIHYVVNCSAQCPSPSAGCPVSCSNTTTNHPPYIIYTSGAPQQEYWLRTPNLPAQDLKCPPCGASPFLYAMEFQVVGPGTFRVSVDPPWYVYGPIPTPTHLDFCADETTRDSCIYTPNDATFIVATRDPAAPARNVLIGDVCQH